MKGAMNSDRFEALLEAKGVDLASWPEAERLAAERLLADSPKARAALAQARTLDDLLGATLTPTPASNDLREAILTLPVAHPRQGTARPTFGFRAIWQTGLGLALVAGLAGFALGITGLVEGPSSASAEADIASLVYGFSVQGPRP